MKFKKLTFIALVLLVFFNCKNTVITKEKTSKTNTEEELYRPNFHFTPKKAWMNDPNGMFYYNGYYHLYFQYHPDSNVWGPMHWGHAISTDMITWSEQPIAIYPDELGTIFSGSAVVDISNSSGLGEVEKSIPIIAMYTNHKDFGNGKVKQVQSIAYSNDEGKTFKKYENNPVIDNDTIKDFRDPKITWDEDRHKWIMSLAAGDKIMFYDSKNLKNWNLLSEFKKDKNSKDGVWECPDLFKLPVKGTEEFKWVLFVSIGTGGPNGGSSTQYFVGDFDGTNFKIDKEFEKSLKENHNYWLDFGKDNYAGVSWSNARTKDGAKLMIGWMSNWDYAVKVPTETWRSAMTTPRKVALKKDDNGYRLISTPVQDLNKYRGTKFKKENIAVNGITKIIGSESIDLASTEINFNLNNLDDKSFTFKLSNKVNDTLLFGYSHAKKSFFIDRKKSGKIKFSEKFANKISYAPRTSTNKNLSGTILIDKTSIELFFDEGETVMTEIFFPNQPFSTFSIETKNRELLLDYIEINQLNIN
ncbi:glycosyl hydrolase family 32 [Polaribacter reichenbachii]|uniref:Glycosyl hydrolase family 32 n=1 Tax=Polaribacter reichenbachii TaxID=996801 RepID=A0A1B8U777_9FLAO|nr:glycoside hydrolase family 32 protein [Polaribacter reichenbachii]APZ46335.1 glycosyl hydrolase family 32 [Polaribacter reichenbachii]AUC20199.1 glycosyl hydrolase family 32 [Polaribacter reichenbachii]OBY67710.1 glycosyl hydrolase family 32 [Polaribacter reichenbachii]